MTCKKCIHFKKVGHVCRCDLFDNIEVYGDVGNIPIKEDCCHFKTNDPAPLSEAQEYCHWRPFKKQRNRQGYWRFMLQTDCGRVVEYTKSSSVVNKEILTEVCSKCKRYIKVHYINGME